MLEFSGDAERKDSPGLRRRRHEHAGDQPAEAVEGVAVSNGSPRGPLYPWPKR